MPREHSKRESLECSDADCSEQRESSIAPETLSEGSKHEVVQSDDEDLPAAELEWGLAQRATDPQYRQRKQKGRFMVSDVNTTTMFTHVQYPVGIPRMPWRCQPMWTAQQHSAVSAVCQD